MSSSKGKKVTGERITVKKSENFAQWYTEVITKAELISYYEDVSGCYVLRPAAYMIWGEIQSWFEAQIRELGVQPCYFPMFVSEKVLQKEADHLEDFAPEVAWVSRDDMDYKLAIRPTSETIMYPYFARWIKSHRDLPLRLNQWTNVVRWEFKNPTPFLRTREFLWQEGHTAWATKEEADAEVLTILDLYARVYEELLAVPVIKGRKSDKEKFAGGDFTTTVEAYIPGAGRAIQGGTSHSLGQNFSRKELFDIKFEDKDGAERRVWQNSWGLTTRTIGVAIMVHGDDRGLVLPPRVASTQVVIVGILYKKPEVNDAIVAKCSELLKQLRAVGVRVEFDERRDKTPAWKFAHYEQRGVPVRIELGEKDLEKQACMLARRDNGSKSSVPLTEVVAQVQATLETIQKDMLAKARRERDANLSIAWTWDEFCTELQKGRLILAPWSLTTESEEWVKEETKKLGSDKNAAPAATEAEETVKGESRALTGAAKTLCIPFNQPDLPEGTMCFTGCGLPAKEWCLWGRSY